jgi:hypothetical protein
MDSEFDAPGKGVGKCMGIFQYSLDFLIENGPAAIETRLFVPKAAIKGVFCLRNVQVDRATASRSSQTNDARRPMTDNSGLNSNRNR